MYRAGTPDGKVPPGLYAEYPAQGQRVSRQGRGRSPIPAQAKVIGDLIRYYQTGEFADWLQFGTDWVQNNATGGFLPTVSSRSIATRAAPRAARRASSASPTSR